MYRHSVWCGNVITGIPSCSCVSGTFVAGDFQYDTYISNVPLVLCPGLSIPRSKSRTEAKVLVPRLFIIILSPKLIGLGLGRGLHGPGPKPNLARGPGLYLLAQIMFRSGSNDGNQM